MRTRSVLAALAAPVLVAGAALAASAGPALAAQPDIKIPAGTPIDLGPAAPCGAGDIVITVQSGHDHITTDSTGYHENATIVGTAALVDPGTGTVLEQGGHANAWFTLNITPGGTVVQQDFVHAQFSSGRIDLSGKFTLNANGVPVVNNQRASCG